MESYPQFLLKDLNPLVFVTGTIDDDSELHGRLISTLEKCNTEIDQRDFPALAFKKVSIDHSYISKKNIKEYQSVDGILKYSSLHKHFELLPSVVVITAAFNMEWQASEWTYLNDSLLEKINRHREQLKGRDVRVFLIALRVGTAVAAPEVIEEKMGNLRRNLTLDNHRTFVVVNLNDVSSQPPNSSMKRISKSIRELSFIYYNVLEKRARFLLKTARIRGSNEGILTVRYSFKLAYFLSFQGLKLQALKYYRQCFDALLGIVYHVDEDLLDQLKAVAEFTHFKICNMFLQNGSVRDAIVQFMTHTSTFAKVYSELAWKHFSWICDQHIVFLQLLDMHQVTNATLRTESVDRFYFLQNALRYSIKRQKDFRSTTSLRVDDETDIRNRSHLRSLVVSPAKYVGAMPILIDPVLGSAPHLLGPSISFSNTLSLTDLDNSESKLTSRYLTESERSVDVSGFIFKLLQRCDEYLDTCAVCNVRRRANVDVLLAEQFIAAGRVEEALPVLLKITQRYVEEKWVGAAVPLLRRILSCCILLGRPTEYLSAAITLYSISRGRGSDGDSADKERERLHADILSLLKCDLPSGPMPSATGLNCVSVDSTAHTEWSFLGMDKNILLPQNVPHGSPIITKKSSFKEPSGSGYLYKRVNYGTAATQRPAEASLSMSTHIAMDSTIGSLFEIYTEYSQPSIEVGNSVTVSLTVKSKMTCAVTIDEMMISFTGNKLFKKIVHYPIGVGDSGKAVGVVEEQASGKSTSKGSSPPLKVKGQCCALYCSSYMGALQGSRMVTALNDDGGDTSVCTACLSIPAGQSVTYAFSLHVSENVLQSLLSADPSVCVETVTLTLRTAVTFPSSSLFPTTDQEFGVGPLDVSADSTSALPSPPLPLSQDSALPPVPPALDKMDSTVQYREVYLVITPLSPIFRKALKDRAASKKEEKAGNASATASVKQVQTLNDFRAFLGPENSPMVLQLTRPQALLDLVHPTPGPTPLTPLSEKAGGSSKVSPKPIPNVTATAKLLQGPVQRLDLIFKTGNNHIINGRIYLSSDFSPSSSSSALFWSPDVAPLLTVDKVNWTPYLLDSIAYHPILLNSSYQPAQPLILPYILPNTYYCIPLFLRSEIQGSYKLRLLTEYVPKKGHSATVSKEVELNVSFLKPLNMNFSLSSEREAQCGVVREGFMSTLLEGDMVNMAASLGCANALGEEIQILGMTFMQPPQVAQTEDYYDDNSNINDAENDQEALESPTKLLPHLFRLADGAASINLLHPVVPVPAPASTANLHCRPSDDITAPSSSSDGAVESLEGGDKLNGYAAVTQLDNKSAPHLGGALDPTSGTSTIPPVITERSEVLLKKGEVYVCSTDIQCVESSTVPSLPFTVQIASIGDLYVDWRLHNDRILSPPDLSRWVRSKDTRTSQASASFDWLLQWGPLNPPKEDPSENSVSAIDRRTSTTRVCGMVFSVPRVKISPAPFTVTINLATTCRRNEVLPLEIVINNKLWTPEHLSLAIDIRMNNTTAPSSSAGSSGTKTEGASDSTPSSASASGPGSTSCGFLVVGNASSLLDISPKGVYTISLSLVPLQTGFLSLPHVCVTWERNSAVVVDLSTQNAPKYVFVRP